MNKLRVIILIGSLLFSKIGAYAQSSDTNTNGAKPQPSISQEQLKTYFDNANKQIENDEDKKFEKEMENKGIYRNQNYNDATDGVIPMPQSPAQTSGTPNLPGVNSQIQINQPQFSVPQIGNIPNVLKESEKNLSPSLIDARESAFQEKEKEAPTTIQIEDDDSISVDVYAKKFPLLQSSIPIPDFSYDPTGRRDPFRPYKIFKKESRQIIDPLTQYELTAFKVVGVLWNVKRPKAIVLAPNGKRYIIEKDTKIGRKDGYVVAIRESEVLVIETFEAEDRTVRSIKSLVIGKTLGGGNAE